MKTEPLFWVLPGVNQTRVQFNEFIDKHNAYIHQLLINSMHVKIYTQNLA